MLEASLYPPSQQLTFSPLHTLDLVGVEVLFSLYDSLTPHRLRPASSASIAIASGISLTSSLLEAEAGEDPKTESKSELESDCSRRGSSSPMES